MDWIKDNVTIVIGIILGLINIVGWVWANFNKAYKVRSTVEGYVETLDVHTKQISDMDSRHKEDYEKLNGKFDELTIALNGYISVSKRSNQVILRDKIYTIYKDMIKKGYILEKDSKNIHDMIDVYKEQGGNSFVCEEILPRLSEFRVFLTDEDAEEYFSKGR